MIREADIAASTEIPSSEFGIDPEGPVSEEENGTVEVPITEPPLEEEDLEEFLSHLDYVTSFEDFGVINCKELLISMPNG